MQNIVKYVNSALIHYSTNSCDIQYLQGWLSKEMKANDWFLFVLENGKYLAIKFNNGVFVNEGYVMNHEKVLKVLGNAGIDDAFYGEDSIKEGISDLDHGTRFEGLVSIESGIPFGFGTMYDDDGLLVYKGIMINWKRFGYGVSYHSNGSVEYEGFWCDDKRCGRGKLYNRRGNVVKEGEWCNGMECDTDYIGNGSLPIDIRIKHLSLNERCLICDWDARWLYNLESIDIGNNCLTLVKTFKIDGLSQLKRLKIGKYSFTQIKESNWHWKSVNNLSKSFHILNCESLKSIEIGEFSFYSFAGPFELKNLRSLQFIKIGEVGQESYNFYFSSFVIRGIWFNIERLRARSAKLAISYTR